jgi:hypothetical protein
MAAYRAWRPAAVHAALLAALILAPLTIWFGRANRYIVFLYEHMGAAPFDPATTGRYWMASLVASGGAAVVYAAYCWLRGRCAAHGGAAWAPPAWECVWLIGALPVGGGVVAITMGLGAPTLPLPLALACAAAALAGLAGAAAPGALAARDPAGLAWLAADGAALVAPLLLLRAVAPEMRLLLGDALALAAAGLSLLAALGWAAIMTLLRRWRGRAMPSAASLYAGGLIQAYLLLPLAHYLLSDPGGPYYVTSADNFFPASPLLQAAILLMVWGMAQGVTRGRAGPLRG